MTLTKKEPKTWLCPKCAHRNLATRSRKCQGCLTLTRPKRRVPPHARTLRDDNYERYAWLSLAIHGGEPEACGVCRKPKAEARKHDRDHDHRAGSPSYGKARGLACTRCNKELLRNATLEEARAVVAYLERVQAYYWEQDIGTGTAQAGDVHAL